MKMPAPLTKNTFRRHRWPFMEVQFSSYPVAKRLFRGSNQVRQAYSSLRHRGQVLMFPELQTVFLETANLPRELLIGRNPEDMEDGTYLCPNDLFWIELAAELHSGPGEQFAAPLSDTDTSSDWWTTSGRTVVGLICMYPPPNSKEAGQ